MANDGMQQGPSNGSAKEVVVDTRLVLVVLGLVALGAVAALGLAVGRRAAEAPVDAAPVVAQANSAAAAAQSTLAPAGLERVGDGQAVPAITLDVPTTVDGASSVKFVVKGKNPVPPDEAPVGPEEARIWFTDLASASWELALGEISPTEPVERNVVIENIGTAPLTIVDAGGSCGCTAVSIESHDVPSGTTTIMRVKYDPRVSNDAGKEIRKQVYVRSNDPLTPVAEFHITANVRSQ